LDDIYYFGGQTPHNQVALVDHVARGVHEIDLRKGDYIGIAGNHWNGYSKGLNRRTNQGGLYPSFKARDHINIVDFPLYAQVPNPDPDTSS